MLEKLLGLFKSGSEERRDEKYLNESVDIYDLEQRMYKLQRERSNSSNYNNSLPQRN